MKVKVKINTLLIKGFDSQQSKSDHSSMRTSLSNMTDDELLRHHWESGEEMLRRNMVGVEIWKTPNGVLTNGSLEAREAVLNIYQDVQTGFQDVLDQCALRHVVPPTWPVHKPVSELRPVVISDPLGLAKVLNHPWSILMTSSLLDDLHNFPTNG